jgi:hypothetical protein
MLTSALASPSKLGNEKYCDIGVVQCEPLSITVPSEVSAIATLLNLSPAMKEMLNIADQKIPDVVYRYN